MKKRCLQKLIGVNTPRIGVNFPFHSVSISALFTYFEEILWSKWSKKSKKINTNEKEKVFKINSIYSNYS